MRNSIIFLSLLLICSALPAQDTIQQISQGRKNAAAQRNKPYVILISADGFRYDYARKYGATNLLKLAVLGHPRSGNWP